MRSKAVWALLALNLLLLASLLGQYVRPNAAYAQVPRPSDYVMIPGESVGANSGIVFIIDTQNGLLGARTYDGARIIDMVPPIDLNRIFNNGGGAGGGGVRAR
jgi:hypothetical protein